MQYILLFLMQPIKNLLNYLFLQLLWKACFSPIISGIALAFSVAASGMAWCIYNFFQIPFIKNFVSDICEVFLDLGSAIENIYANIISLFRKLPEEIGVKTDMQGAKGYVKYVASNAITIAGFGYLSYHFYHNYYKLFQLDHNLNEERGKYGLEKIQTHYPINLFITGTIAALQFSACVATAISVVVPGSPFTKFRVLAIAGMAELALFVYKHKHDESLGDLKKFEQTFEQHKTDITTKDTEIKKITQSNKLLSAQVLTLQSRNNMAARTLSAAFSAGDSLTHMTRVITDGTLSDGAKVLQLSTLLLTANNVQNAHLQIEGHQDTNGVNV